MSDQDIMAALPVLETERLVLRKLRRQDLPDLYALTSDEEVTVYLSWEAHQSMQTSQAYLESMIQRYERAELAPWGVERRADNRLIGTCGFVTWYRHDARAEIAYAFARPSWGRGLATEAVHAIVAFGFSVMGLNRIEARCLVENRASARVMEKIGMRLEGVMREQIFVKGDYRNLKLYSILRREYDIPARDMGAPEPTDRRGRDSCHGGARP